MSRPAKVTDETSTVCLMEMPNGGASDITLKKSMIEISGALDRIRALRPVTWYWKTDHDNRHLQHGFVAQEVERTFPELVEDRTWDDGTDRKYLSTKELIPYLVGAIVEQQEQIDELRRTLKEKNES